MTTKIFVPPGHFYSPVSSDADNAIALENARREAMGSLPGISIDDAAMVALWRKFCGVIDDMPFQEEAGADTRRYHYANKMFPRGDACAYYGMIRTFKPNRIIEIGSGHSSAFALDVQETTGFPNALTFIEPYPKRLKSLMREADKSAVTLIEDFVQNVPLERFDALEANDILFVDSSHVVKPGSDVCYEVFQILPRLKPGVIIHFHDCFWPFEYPEPWLIRDNRSWNELYLLRAFLQFNPAFEILFFNSYFFQRHRDVVNGPAAQAILARPGGGLWLRRR
ncbi:MAG: class I SAM-dependent methyltransferase [Rhodobacteraceae bacterium]|jgi:hypothetical protein|nr:class I SAM-dependent methyltransferase [Paracoccaceae bacterium]